MTPRSLEGKVVVVTGAAGGIGQAVARRLAAEGARLVLADRDVESVTALADSLPGEVLGHGVDVGSEDAMDALFRAVLDRFGRIDGLHNNAGIEGRVGRLVDSGPEEFEAVLAVNVIGVFLGCRAALRTMQRTGRPIAVVNTASATGLRGVYGSAAYSTSKHAVIGLTRCAALEAAPLGGRVNALCPGVTETRMMRSLESGMVPDDPGAAKAFILSRVPMGRYGTPDEAAALAAWLLSDRSRYATGAVFAADGGYTAG